MAVAKKNSKKDTKELSGEAVIDDALDLEGVTEEDTKQPDDSTLDS